MLHKSAMRHRIPEPSWVVPVLALSMALLAGPSQAQMQMASVQVNAVLQNLGIVSKPNIPIPSQQVLVPHASKTPFPGKTRAVVKKVPAPSKKQVLPAKAKAPKLIQMPHTRPMAFFDARTLAAFKELQKGNIKPLMDLAPYGSAIGRGFGGVNGVKTSGGFGARNAPPPPSMEVRAQTLRLQYHGGRLLTGPKPLVVHPIWYGTWASRDQNVIRDFIRSFTPPGVRLRPVSRIPAGTVARWWAVPGMYQDRRGRNVSRDVLLGQEYTFRRSVYGNNLTESTIRKLIRRTLNTQGGTLPAEDNHVFLVLNGPEVSQSPAFCKHMCAFHDYLPARATAPRGKRGRRLAYAWIGNPSRRCPEFCGFPFTKPPYIPDEFATVLQPPNGNILADGMVGLIAHELAEMATDPFISGWFAGSALMPNEVADMCIGIYGMGAFPSNPGTVRRTSSGRSFNVEGINDRKFLIPWIWDNPVAACAQTP